MLSMVHQWMKTQTAMPVPRVGRAGMPRLHVAWAGVSEGHMAWARAPGPRMA
jgi:hypothetical protein